MNAEQEKIRTGLADMVGYFEGVARHTQWHPWRKVEYEVVAATVALLAKNELAAADFVEIAACINQIAGQEHADGSGWMDFQLRISHFFRTFGYKSDWNDATGEFTFYKAEPGAERGING